MKEKMDKRRACVRVYRWLFKLFSVVSLRDYFAAKAIQGLLAHPACGSARSSSEATRQIIKYVAEEAYAIADAMIKAREEIK